jgi:hypothetical protein
MEEDYSTYDPEVTSALWNQYYANQPQNTPSGFQFNENQALANALRGYEQDPYFNPVTYMPGYEDTLTRQLLENKDSGLTTTQPYQQQPAMQMPDMSAMGMMGSGQQLGGSGIFGGPTGQATGAIGTYGQRVNAVGVPASEASTGGLNWGGVQGNATAQTGGYAQSSQPGMFGNGGSLGGGWFPAVGGAIAGYSQGRQNYRDNPNMWNGKDGYGKYHRDYRAELGGGVLGGVLGYFGGPFGAAVAGPVVKYAHKVMEPTTRKVVNFGDKVGGVGGAMMLDPISTAASGKYSWGQVGKGALLGPFTNLFK